MADGLGIVITFIIILFIVGIVIYIISIFNGLIRLKNSIRKSWANIDVLLKQRYDELPNLVETVKGYMKHEKEVLMEITKARTALMNARTMKDKARASNTITESLKTIFAVSENYPKLRANENFLKLQERISSLENEIADRREFYNNSVYNYNVRIQSIPDVLIANMLGFKEEELFKATEEEKERVAVKLAN